MRILLINPPFDRETSSASTALRKLNNYTQPLGLAYIAAALEQVGAEVEICDCSFPNQLTELQTKIQNNPPQYFGITATTPSFSMAKKIAILIRKEVNRPTLFIGGPHVSACPQEALAQGLFDIAVVGEGEETVKELFHKNFKKLETIPGIIFLDNNQIIQTTPRSPSHNMDDIAFPARHLLPPLDKYIPTPASVRRVPYATIMTSRGCPSLCSFCDKSVFGNKVRFRSIENICDEIEVLITQYNVKEIRFFDDTFTLDRKRVIKLCHELIKRKWAIPWTCLTRVDKIDRDLLSQMKKAGCWQILLGIESGDQEMLNKLQKGSSVEQNIKAINIARKCGLEVRCDFLVGAPGETWKSFYKTIQFALQQDIDYAHFNKFIPFPGTQLFNELISKGHTFDLSTCSILDDSSLPYQNPNMKKDLFFKELNKAYCKFYHRPSYILRRLRSIRTLYQAKAFLKAAIATLAFRKQPN